VLVRVPEVFTLDLGDAYIVIIHGCHDSRAPQILERSKRFGERYRLLGLPQEFWGGRRPEHQSCKLHMTQQSSQSHSHRPHRVAVIVDEGTNPFEVGVATELFGLPRPELGMAESPYEVALCTPRPKTRIEPRLLHHDRRTRVGRRGRR
jgi:hypothetical protein